MSMIGAMSTSFQLSHETDINLNTKAIYNLFKTSIIYPELGPEVINYTRKRRIIQKILFKKKIRTMNVVFNTEEETCL